MAKPLRRTFNSFRQRPLLEMSERKSNGGDGRKLVVRDPGHTNVSFAPIVALQLSGHES
ncbi:MAG: hypothetical protein ACT4N8_06250 [Sphingosinicella sp.]